MPGTHQSVVSIPFALRATVLRHLYVIQKMKYKAMFLDFYGTCVAEDDAVIERIIAEIAKDSAAPSEEILHSWKFSEACAEAHGPQFRTQKEIELSTLQSVLDKFSVNLDVWEISKGLFEYWSTPEVYPDTLDFLRSQDVPIIIVSNIDNSFFESALQQIPFDFSDVVTSEDVRAYKPRSEPFKQALERNSLRPEEVIHIGDSYSSDVAGAVQCGIDAIWVNRRNRTKKNGLMKLQVSTLSEIRWDNKTVATTPASAPR